MPKNIFLMAVLGLLLRLNSFGQDILSQSAIVLPISPQTSYVVSSGNTVNIVSGQSVILGPGTTLSLGSTVTVAINPFLIPPPPSNPSNDLNKNWIYTRSYDENGNEIGASKNFFDNNGNPTQAQSKDETSGHILASQTLYDAIGRSAGITLRAPINNSAFAYSSTFVTNTSGTNYNYTNFDWNPGYNTNYPYAKVNSPDPVGITQPGGLGWYYSSSNNWEPAVASTSYPFSRNDFYHDGTGAPKRSATIGDQLTIGSGHETKIAGSAVQNELANYIAVRNKFFTSAVVGNAGINNLAGNALQTMVTDPNGMRVLTVKDLSGKTLMTGRADVNGWLTVTNSFLLSNVASSFSFVINTDKGVSRTGTPSGSSKPNDISNFSVQSGQQITVTCITCDAPSVWTGVGNDFSGTGTGYNYKITSAYPFSVSASTYIYVLADPLVKRYDMAPSRFDEPPGNTSQYFQLGIPGTVSITGAYKLYDMTTETDITSGFASGSTVLPAGNYRVTATAPILGSNPAVNNVNVTYTNKYSDISYVYYNQLGQVIADVMPNGVQALINNLAGYASIPFATTYEYDLQGRLTALTSPDGGRSEYVYRQDGNIRFSQNAFQRASANAGTGNQEKFSYINYDVLGRPSESGEYVVPTGASLNFASTKSNTALQESIAVDGGLNGGSKNSQINAFYDLPATDLAAGANYVQDAGFLKGALSYSSNGNSTTWYNYDDHGRVTWVVKQLAGLSGYKTIDYTYNEQGNVIRVDYQKGTPTERFVHYYSYNADGRLVNVQTSRDDVNKLQQAKYFYYLHGPLKRIELADNLQGIDYMYTPQGWLKAINTPTGDATKDPGKDGMTNGAFAKDVFGMQLEYFPNDYSRTGSNITGIPTGQPTYYDGNVNGISWQSNKPSGLSPAPNMYTYGYDAKYQLTAATWGTPNFTTPAFTPGSMFKESGITYDANGNINGLQRTGSTGTLSDDFSKYTYLAGTNKLAGVANTSGSSTYASYTYNEIGQLKSQIKASTTIYLKYNVTGKITGIYSDATMTNAIVTYSYDENGNRIKAVNQNGTTYYVYDASGNVIAIYTGTSTPVMSEVPFYGSERLGTYNVSGSNYYYELRDNVGSVKVVINRNKTGGQADVVQYNDYYPFGSIAQSGGITYRYEYQGTYAEKDPTTGFNNFDLRMYDGKVGRWISTDPKGQYASPYEGMGNNPVIRSDPDGGIDDVNTNSQTGKRTVTPTMDHFDRYFTDGKYQGWAEKSASGYLSNLEFSKWIGVLHSEYINHEVYVLSEKGRTFLKAFEELKLNIYDASQGHGDWTIGWGHHIQPGEDFSNGITAKRADDLFTSDLYKSATGPISRKVTVPLNQQQFDALTIYVYNGGGLAGTQMLVNINSFHGGSDCGVIDEMNTIKSAGEVNKGLIIRRLAEHNIWRNGVYNSKH